MTDKLVLKYSHNIVEHLGLKLYQNQPTRVIAELVSNSWDADATRTSITMKMEGEERWVAVADNGHGMTRNNLLHSYLVIGHPKRANPNEKSPGGRPLMGRKGIGKLAAFGIARFVDVITCANDDGTLKTYWLRFDRDALLSQGEEEHTYAPHVIADGVASSEVLGQEDDTGQISKWLELTGSSAGTLVLMTELSLGKAISSERLLSSLGSRFTVAIGGSIDIDVNGTHVSTENSLPRFEFRVPDAGKQVITLPGGQTISAWAGFVENASWPQDQAGVGVYAHGKIAQDRPFFFGVKGKEIYSRYMLAFIEADWLDEFNKDLISTDRTSINWDVDEVQELHDEGQRLVRSWINKFENWRSEQDKKANKDLVLQVVSRGGAPRVTDAEQDEIVRLVSSITPSFGKADVEAKERLVAAVSDAWVQKPMRRLVKDLWSTFGASADTPPHAFTAVIERLSSHSVPESLNLAVIFAQRAFALTRLHDYVHHGIETDLQKLIERFPWIVEPDIAVLTANKSLRTAAIKAEELGQQPVGTRTVGGIASSVRPDFVFLSSPEEHQIVVVELKNPQEDLTSENLGQLQDYLFWLDSNYPDADIRGYLIGRKPASMKTRLNNLSIVPWTNILQRSRSRHLELLSAMLLKSGAEGSGDARVLEAIDLAGPEASALLARLAEDHRELRDLISAFEVTPEAK